MAIPWKRDRPLFAGREVSFEECYPNLEDVRVEYEERGSFGDPGIDSPQTNYFFIRKFGPNVKCGNSECGGGYLFQTIADSIVSAGEVTRKGHMRCGGIEKMGRRHTRPCINSIDYTVTLIPKQK
jgi:hypothetical protein